MTEDSDDPITSEVVTVTPAMAERWLKRNHPKNRPIQWGRVQSFVADIERGAWRLTHQGICFDAEDQLIDGQHRLHAIVASGTAVKILVCRNAEGEFEAPIDRGQPRTLALISGLSRGEIAALGVLRQLEAGSMSNTPTTLEDLKEFGAHHAEAMQRFREIKGHYKLLSGVAAAVIWTLPIDYERVELWTQALITGEMLEHGHSALALRRWFSSKFRRTSWDYAMVTFNCLRHDLCHLKLNRCFTTPSGYRAITSRRRMLHVPHTPPTHLVPSLALKPAAGESHE